MSRGNVSLEVKEASAVGVWRLAVDRSSRRTFDINPYFLSDLEN